MRKLRQKKEKYEQDIKTAASNDTDESPTDSIHIDGIIFVILN